MVHLRKEWVPTWEYSKLKQRKIGLFRNLQKINDNVYIIDLPKYYAISNTFNVQDLYEYHSPEQITWQLDDELSLRGGETDAS